MQIFLYTKREKENIKKYVKKEIIFQTLQQNRKQTQLALEILLMSGLVDAKELIEIRSKINTKIQNIIKKEKLKEIEY